MNKLLLGSNEVTEEGGGAGVILSHFDFQREREGEVARQHADEKRTNTQ